MHKKMSRIVVLLLVVCLTLGNVVPVLAVDDTGSTDTVTATAETSPAAEGEASAAPAATPAVTAETKETPAAAPTPAAKTEGTEAAASPEATATATAGTTEEPTAEPSATATATATATAGTTEAPTAEPSATATATAEPTEEPAATPTAGTTEEPTTEPSPTATATPEPVKPTFVSKVYDAAPVAEKAVSGIKATGGNFTLDTKKTTAMISGGKVYITLTAATTADYIYIGSENDLKPNTEGKSVTLEAAAAVADSSGKKTFHFVFDSCTVGGGTIGVTNNHKVPVYAVNSDGSYTTVTLQFPKIMPVNNKVTAVTYRAATNADGELPLAKDAMTVVSEKGAALAAFTVGEATAVKVNGIIYATIYVLPKSGTTFTYSYFSIGSKSRLDNGSEISAVAGVVTADKTKQAFHFTLDPSQLDEEGKVEVSYIKSAYATTGSNWNGSPYYLKVSVDQIEERDAEVAPNPVSYAAAPVAEKTVSGLTAAMQNDTAAPFAVASATAVRCGETSYLTLAVDPVDGAFPYTHLYFGTEEALKDVIANGGKYPVVAPKTANGQQSYHFTLPSTAAGTTLAAYAVKANGFDTTYEPLTLAIPEIPVGVKFAEKSYDAAPVAEKEAAGLYAAEPGTTESSALFPISSATAVICIDTMYVTLNVNSSDYTWLYLGEKTPLESGGAFEAVKSENGAFHFTLNASDAGKTLSVCAGKDDGSYTPLDLIIPQDISVATAAPLPAISALPGDLAEANIKVMKKDGTEFKMFAAAKTGLIVTADKLLVHFETANTSYDRMYFGKKEDLSNDDVFKYYVQGTPRTGGGWVFEFELPLSYQGAQNLVCLGQPDGSSWYTKADLYINIPADAGDPGEELPDAGIHMLAGGSQVEQSFKISSSTAMLLNGKVYCTITGTAYASKTADKLYLGDRNDKDKSSYVTGTQNEDGTTTFTYTVDAERQGSYTPAVLGYTDSTWDTSQSYFLNVPNFNGTFDAAAFTDGVYDLFGYAYPQNGGIPVDAGATLTVSGDTITIKYVTRTSSASKLYFGSVTDDAATRDANAVSAEILNPDDPFSYLYFSVTMPKSALAEKIPFVSCSKSGTWSSKQDYLLIPRYLPRIGDATDPVDPVDPSDPSEIKDGTYYTTAETGAAMFKVRRVVITAKDGKYDVTLTLNSTGYDYLYPGTGTQAAAAGKSAWAPAKVVSGTIDGETRDNWHTYTITVDELTNPLAVTSHSQKNDKWYDRSITLDLENLKRTAEDGEYSVTAECDAAMFKIVDAKLNVVNGTIMATLTLSGTGYDYLYPGTGDEAEKDKDNWAPFEQDENGKYTYTIPVSELDKPITISSHSQKNDKWYDRTVTFLSDSLKKIGDATDPVNPNPTPTPTPTPAPSDPTKPDDESDHVTDTSGSTSRVDNSTTLKDGVYAPDDFSFSGGSGRTRIVCDKVTVKNGQAYATIRFVSSSGNPPQYSYVKASGNTYYTNDGCTFTIPVELNKNNRILGMTTKMSSAHEIEYIIFVQLKTTANNQKDNKDDNNTLSTEAPEIMGLTFEEEIKLEHAQYLKLFRYEGDIVLAEIDVVTDTVLDTEKAKAELEKADKAAAADSAEETAAEEESTDNAQIKADYVAELYKHNVVRYLLVPEGTELPAGLEKQLIIVTLPVKSLYVMDEAPIDTLDIFEALDLVKVIGAEKSGNETLSAALTDGSTVYGGTWDKPEYKLLVKNETDLVLTSGKLLPLSEETLKARKETAPADAEELTTVEYRDRLYDLADRFAVLDIPMLIDRSADEADALAQADWLNLYGILLGDETTANRMIREITAREG